MGKLILTRENISLFQEENKMEIELKVKVKDVKALKTRLAKLRAEFKERITNIDHYFSVKHRDFMKTKECLRIRVVPENEIAILTYKPETTDEMKKSGFIWKKELEIAFNANDSEALKAILECLDCQNLVTVYKTRENFEVDGLKITIDEVKGIGSFMEIEKISENISAAKEEVWSMLERLGFGKKDLELANYRDLMLKSTMIKKAK